MKFAFLVKGYTKIDMLCALGDFSLHYSYRVFVINPNKCYTLFVFMTKAWSRLFRYHQVDGVLCFRHPFDGKTFFSVWRFILNGKTDL